MRYIAKKSSDKRRLAAFSLELQMWEGIKMPLLKNNKQRHDSVLSVAEIVRDVTC